MIYQNKVRYFTVLVGALLFISRSYSQDLITKNYTLDDGIANVSIYSVMYDADGYIWLATETGASRFDGKRFINYTTTDGLADNQIYRMAQDSKRRIWFMGSKGILCYFLDGKFYSPSNDSMLKKIPRALPFFYLF